MGYVMIKNILMYKKSKIIPLLKFQFKCLCTNTFRFCFKDLLNFMFGL